MEHTFFSANRQALLDRLKKGALVVVTGYGEIQRTSDSAMRFEQEANFWYLTGVESPDWWLILDGAHGTEWLVEPEMTEIQRVFDGGAEHEQVKAKSGVKTILTRDEAFRRLRDLTKHHSIVYTTEQPKGFREHAHFQLNSSQAELKKTLERLFQNVQVCNRELAILRTIKKPEEIAAIEKAIKVTAKAIEQMKMVLPRAKYEYELQAELDYSIRRQGAWGHAYDPIVASGLNACTLHYSQNNDRLAKKSLVLLDVGARVDGYAADISRTYAVSEPSKRQRAVHDAVRQAQEAIIASIKPGLTFEQYEENVEAVMKRTLAALGLDVSRYRDYFPHAVSHGLGIDVHDLLTGYETLQPGMVLTVEPGIYIRQESIGIRIEDDILVTDMGHRNLSRGISTEVV